MLGKKVPSPFYQRIWQPKTTSSHKLNWQSTIGQNANIPEGSDAVLAEII